MGTQEMSYSSYSLQNCIDKMGWLYLTHWGLNLASTESHFLLIVLPGEYEHLGMLLGGGSNADTMQWGHNAFLNLTCTH